MSSRVKIKLNKAGVRELLRSSEAQQICMEEASRIQSNAGEGFEVGERNYPERKGAAVYPATDKAYYHNLKHNTLLKAMK